jgi:hypothetical protein
LKGSLGAVPWHLGWKELFDLSRREIELVDGLEEQACVQPINKTH